MIKERLDNKTIKRILLGLFVITVITFAFLMIKDTHAYYNYSTGPIPIFTGKVGNFAKQNIEEYLASQGNSGLETKENMEARNDTLRRYQGSSVNNYICFGTTNVSDCTKDTDKYMYRIIGVDTVTKELKIQKREALNTKYSWFTSSTVSYEQSNVYTNVLKNIFYNDKNYVSNDWKTIISNHNWKYGEVNNYNLSGVEMLKTENNFTTYVTSRVGLVTLSDYYLTKSNSANCSTSSGGCETNWLWIKNGNDSNPPHQWAEWTMNRYTGSNPFHITSNGYVSHSDTGTLALSIRPVMYLSSNIKLSGKGTIEEPFMIEKLKKPPTTGDTSPLTDRTTDVNLMFYVQDITNPENYTIMENTPALVSGYTVNETKSNCIPQESDTVDYPDYYIDDDGTVTVEMSQDKPNQIVCRIYYDYGKTLDDDIIVFALIEDELGMVIKNNKHYTMTEDIPTSGYTYDSTISGCNTENNIKTTISYDTSTGLTFKTDGPNLCYAYFNKAS